MLEVPDRPLDRVGSIKVKLGVLVAASIVVVAVVLVIGDQAEVPGWITVPVTLAVALLVTQWLARGMVAPLREMTAAAQGMAGGDLSQRVTATSADEIGELARAFNSMAADLASVDQQRRELVSTVSHELRTPLAAQRAVLENLVDGVVRPDDEVLGSALAQAERISVLVEDLLDLSRVDGGARSLALGEVRIAGLLEECVAEARLSGRTVSYAVHAPADLVVTADRARIAQVVANLLDNAARHSPEGGTVRVAAGSGEGEGPAEGPVRPGPSPAPSGAPWWWWLDVSDDGPGIPGPLRGKVFERFGTGSSGTSTGGTGLGLAIARWVCELHGGTIRAVDPAPGSTGARIRVTLPVAPTAMPSSPAPPPTAPVRSVPTRSAAPVPPPRPSRPAPLPHRTAGPPPRPDPTQPPTTFPPPPSQETTMTTHVPGPVLPPARPPAVPAANRQLHPYASGRPLIDQLFGRAWPETALPPQPRIVVSAVLVGILAAVLLPYRDLGLGVLLVLLASAAVMWSGARRRLERWTLVSAALCLALGSLLVLRADNPVVILGIAVVGALVTTALTGARSLLAILVGGLLWVLSGLRGLPLLGRTITLMSRRTAVWAVVRTVAVSVVLVVVFGALFASADALFGSWVSVLVPELDWASFTFRTFVWFFVSGIVLAGAYLALNPPAMERLTLPPGGPLRRSWEWFVPMGVLLAVFAAFIGSQAAALDKGYVRRTTGLSYGTYVHQGFAQLTVATLLTLAVVALAARHMPRSSPRQNLVARGFLVGLCLLTLAVVASALTRMSFYQKAYGYTTLRVYVDAFELWLGIVIVVVLVAVVTSWRDSRPSWIPRAALLTGALVILVLGLLNPDAWVAERNIARHTTARPVDAFYLTTLGDDAVPVIADSALPEDLKRCILSAGAPTGPGDDLLAWNLGRARADAVRTRLGITPSLSTECDALLYASTIR